MPSIPVITLLSDLGTSHPSIGNAKVLLSEAIEGTSVVDLSHRVTAGNLQLAAYLLKSAYYHFPVGSFHLIMVDVLFGERHRMLLCRINEHYFLAPDNGILSLAFGGQPQDVWLCREFNGFVSITQWVVYASQAIAIIREEQDLNNYFSRFLIKEVAQIIMQKPIGARLDCAVLHIDRYGNIVIDLSKKHFDELIGDGPFSIRLPREEEITTVSNHYNDVPPGGLLCRFNSHGLMEIAINHGSATNAFEFDIATDKGMNYSIITINF